MNPNLFSFSFSWDYVEAKFWKKCLMKNGLLVWVKHTYMETWLNIFFRRHRTWPLVVTVTFSWPRLKTHTHKLYNTTQRFFILPCTNAPWFFPQYIVQYILLPTDVPYLCFGRRGVFFYRKKNKIFSLFAKPIRVPHNQYLDFWVR